MKRNIIGELKKCKEEGCITEIYNTYDEDDSTFSVGIILDVKEAYFTYAALSANGEFYGICLDRTDTVYRICKKSRYINKLYEILRLYEREACPKQFRCLSEAAPVTFLKKAMEIGMPVSVSVNDADRYSVTGFMRYVDEDLFEIETVDVDAAIFNGTEMISTESISCLCCAGMEERVLFDLHKAGFIL